MVGVLGAAALVLAVAGVGKLIRPLGTSRAADALGAGRLAAAPMVRLFGLAEFALAGWVLVIGGRLAAGLLAFAYLFLALVATRLLRVAPQQDCGCFGKPDQPISRSHLFTDIFGAAVSLGAVIWSQPALLVVLSRSELWLGLGLAAMVALLTWLLYEAMTTAPQVLALRTTAALR